MEALGLNPGKKISEKMKISAAVSCRFVGCFLPRWMQVITTAHVV